MHALAEELRRLRLEKKWSQEYVGMIIGLSQPQYHAYEHDAIPPLERLQALAQLYGRPLKDFTDLLPVAHQMHQPQNGAEKNAIGTQASTQDSTSTNYARPLSDLREHLERLKGRVDLLSRELNDFLRHIRGGKSLIIRA